ncbi:hypothetical protein ASPBRDRAFT_678148 [Aspergillus brasiliensis CBS 101740]|uniref:Uncharacterized protein n=1 Tax=Aspergillus brasiliensis (strain CBS 101740 / IMI 381727 / IBT 21946) TaxID=767769 RepID=A0A1L9UDP8_ASPBC|nr:hypothetical protein ASPBRDRAFT_678148 [Aspergillus brasiliensis CBS 101740]
MVSRPPLHWIWSMLWTGVTTLAILGSLVPATVRYRENTAEVHRILEIFRSRGQLFVETFPPLSYHLAAANRLWLLEWIVHGAHALFVWTLFYTTHPVRLGASIGTLSAVLLSAGLYFQRSAGHPHSYAQEGMNAVEGSRALGETIALSIVLWARARTGPLRRLNSAGVFECLLVICIFAVTFPFSETSLGGNYNLHYLPASLRRELRPAIGAYSPGISEMGGRSFPVHSLVPGAPISLYIPRAGFLWTDDLAWDINSHKFNRKAIQPSERQSSTVDAIEEHLAHVNDKDSRIIFSDEFNTIGPWFFDQVLAGEYDPSDPVVAARIWPGQLVYLRQFQTGEYVTVSMDGLTLSDLYDNNLDDEVRRLHISADAQASALSEWQILYDTHHDRGVRLWNKAANCYLATSYRTYPNMHARDSNDTVLEVLHLELEACCTYPPSRAASTFYVVDGVSKPSRPSTWLPPSTGRLALYETRLRAHGAFTIDLIRAMWNLFSFRRRHAHLQDMSLNLAGLHIGVPHPQDWRHTFQTIIAGGVLLHLGQLLRAQRTHTPARKRHLSHESGPMPQVQLWYLVAYLAKTAVGSDDLWDCHFALGLAWITIIDGLNLVLQS